MSFRMLRLVVAVLLLSTLTGLSAQRSPYTKTASDKEKKESKTFKEKLWYGAGINLGFSGFNGTSAFGVGLSPMVGYKIVDRVSVGPRLSMFYTAQKVPGYKAFNLLDSELGAFLRVHVFRGFFLQGEVAQGWDQNLYYNDRGVIEKQTTTRLNQYVGAGYSFGQGRGGFSQEVALMYNFTIANDIYTNQSPLEYRLAFTYGF